MAIGIVVGVAIGIIIGSFVPKALRGIKSLFVNEADVVKAKVEAEVTKAEASVKSKL
jgi:large-conductance mechanosensitive channel